MTQETKQTPKRRWPAHVAWLAAGFLLAGLVFADPFHWHSLDDRVRSGSATSSAAVDEETGL